MVEEISSFSNPLVKRIKRLRQKKFRRQEEAFFVEGLRVVLTAVEQGAPVESLIYCPELLTSEAAWHMLRQAESRISQRAVSAAIFESISGRDNPAGLGAIVRTQWTGLDEMTGGPNELFVALIETAEPGNLGTILRTMDAVGAKGVILVGDTVDPHHPSAVKASMGALFTVQIGRVSNSEALFDWARKNQLLSVASSARGKESYTEASYRLPCLLLLGSEGPGLPAPIMAACDKTVAIPMAGTASSLNLAVAAGLLLYEIRRSGSSQATT